MKRPAFQFYPADWKSNAKLRRCSEGARGAWMDVLCLLHDCDEYGVIRWPLTDIARAAGAPLKLLKELAEKGVFKGGDKGLSEPFVYVPFSGRQYGDPVLLIDAAGSPLWFCSRMVRDEYVRSNAGASTRFQSKKGILPEPSGEMNEREILRIRVLAKNDGKCYHCSIALGGRWEIDHLHPRSRGGSSAFTNLVPSCVECNQSKSNTLPDEFTPPRRSPTHRQGDGPSSSSSSASSVREDEEHRHRPPAFDEVKKFAASSNLGIKPECVEGFFDEMESLQWTYRGTACVKTSAWQARFRRFASNWANNERR